MTTPVVGITSLTNVTSSVDVHKIVGGDQVRPGQYPFVAGLWPASGPRPYYGGAIVNKK